MAYDPLTGRYTPDPTPTPFGQAGSATVKPKTRLQQFQEEKAQRDADIAVAKKAQQDATAAAFANKPADEPGFTWRFVTLAGGGGEWRKYKSSTGPTGGGDDGGGDTGGTAAADLLARQEEARIAEEKRRAGQSAYDLLFTQFAQYGMGALVEPLKQFIQQGMSSAEFTLRLRDTDAYKKRFAANASRIAKGLGALSEAEYIGLEDQYQNIMRNYGLPANYYTRGDMGRQEGFEKFLANDVSAVELEDRIATAQKRVINANPEVSTALKQFYPDITNSDILAYTLDPEKGLEGIKRKITAAEIGGAAIAQGLQTGVTRAEELAQYGVTKDQAQQGFQTIASVIPRAGVLADIYKTGPYGQTQAEQEVFGLAGAEEASKQRRKLTELERASFSGSAGAAQGALGRERAMGQGQF
jgi:hypothetical protein